MFNLIILIYKMKNYIIILVFLKLIFGILSKSQKKEGFKSHTTFRSLVKFKTKEKL
jgi:hypothetical protein